MRKLGFHILLLLSVSGCASHLPLDGFSGERAPANSDLGQLQGKLGLRLDPHELGLTEKAFDSCKQSWRGDGGRCGVRYFAVLNFRLVCRDSEETVQTVVTSVTPLSSAQIKWQLSGMKGFAKTDAEGFGQVSMVTASSMRGQRLALTVGKEFLGKDISDITQIVVPNYWCKQN